MDSKNTFIVKDYIVDRRRIGKGSFSTIYKCYQKQTKKEFALKEIVIDRKKNVNVKREFEIMRKLNHKNIVKIHDVIVDTQLNNIYFIMDYYENGDLSSFLNKTPLKEKFARKYMKQLSEGLRYLLDNNIIHRDLKPQNILLSNNFEIKITDFGFATYYSENKVINTLCGSPMYMAPEIITRNGYDHKSDLWSVGIILYEMLHGYTPFNVSNFLDLIKEIKKSNIMIHADISTDCKDLIDKLCKTNPLERIEWKEFFNHVWFENDELLNEENNLLDIDFNRSLPNINIVKNDKQFCSFIHKSLADTETINENMEMKFLDSLEDSDNEYISAESNNDLSSSESEDEDEDEGKCQQRFKNSLNQSNINGFVNVARPIEIINPRKQNEFVLINEYNLNTTSLPLRKKTLTDSFRDYLYSSIKILKDSYHYISNNSV